MIFLPWPPRELNPNCKVHWAKKAKAVKAYRTAAGWAAKAENLKIDHDKPITVHITFYPPDKRHRDEDNMLASLKSGLDGIADGLGVNDNRFRTPFEVGKVIKGGKVMVVIEPC